MTNFVMQLGNTNQEQSTVQIIKKKKSSTLQELGTSHTNKKGNNCNSQVKS
jgi:hypothetical protein